MSRSAAMTKWPKKPRANPLVELAVIGILVFILCLKQAIDATVAIVDQKEPCCQALLNSTTCATDTAGGASCCATVDDCVGNDKCLSECIFDALGLSVAQFVPGPPGAFVEFGLFVAVLVVLVLLGLIGRFVDRCYAPIHETLACAKEPNPLAIIGVPLSYAVVLFNCIVVAANVGAQLVVVTAQTAVLAALALPVALICAPLSKFSGPSFRFIRHVQVSESSRQAALGINLSRLCRKKDERDTVKFYGKSFVKLCVPTKEMNPLGMAARYVAFTKALAAILFFDAWPSLVGLMWFMIRLFATSVVCLADPFSFMKEYGYSVRQRQRISKLAYPQFWGKVAMEELSGDVATGVGTQIAKEELTGEAKAAAKSQLQVTAKVQGKHALNELLWGGVPMPPAPELIIPTILDVLGETVFLVLFFVKAAGLTEKAIALKILQTASSTSKPASTSTASATRVEV